MQTLLEIVKSRALKFGDFTLVSGQKSTYYLDGKQVTLHAAGARQVAVGLLEMLDGIAFDAIGGMSIGADPMIGSILAVAAEQERDLVGFLVRKEAKGHGTKRYIEGPLQPGARVVIVDDVITTGGSSIKAIERVREFGADVVQVVAIVDRLQGGAAAFAELGIPFQALMTIEDLGVNQSGSNG